MESNNNISTILNRKIEKYNYDDNNLIAESEITITITLNEYRQRIKSDATRQYDIDKANADKYERLTEIKQLKEENAKLKSEIYELTKAKEKEQNDE